MGATKRIRQQASRIADAIVHRGALHRRLTLDLKTTARGTRSSPPSHHNTIASLRPQRRPRSVLSWLHGARSGTGGHCGSISRLPSG